MFACRLRRSKKYCNDIMNVEKFQFLRNCLRQAAVTIMTAGQALFFPKNYWIMLISFGILIDICKGERSTLAKRSAIALLVVSIIFLITIIAYDMNHRIIFYDKLENFRLRLFDSNSIRNYGEENLISSSNLTLYIRLFTLISAIVASTVLLIFIQHKELYGKLTIDTSWIFVIASLFLMVDMYIPSRMVRSFNTNYNNLYWYMALSSLRQFTIFVTLCSICIFASQEINRYTKFIIEKESN